MIPVLLTSVVMVGAGLLAFVLFRYSPALRSGPRIDSRKVRNEVRKHPRLAAVVSARLDPSALTGLALTIAAAVAVVGAVFFGLVFFMVRRHFGFADFDVSAARFAARHATHRSTDGPADLHPARRRSSPRTGGSRGVADPWPA